MELIACFELKELKGCFKPKELSVPPLVQSTLDGITSADMEEMREALRVTY